MPQSMLAMIFIPLAQLISAGTHVLVQVNIYAHAVLGPWQFNSQHRLSSVLEIHKGAGDSQGRTDYSGGVWTMTIKASKDWPLKGWSGQSLRWRGKVLVSAVADLLSLRFCLSHGLCSPPLWLLLPSTALRALWCLFFPGAAMDVFSCSLSGKHSCTKLVYSKWTLLKWKEKPKWNRKTVNSVKINYSAKHMVMIWRTPLEARRSSACSLCSCSVATCGEWLLYWTAQL